MHIHIDRYVSLCMLHIDIPHPFFFTRYSNREYGIDLLYDRARRVARMDGILFVFLDSYEDSFRIWNDLPMKRILDDRHGNGGAIDSCPVSHPLLSCGATQHRKSECTHEGRVSKKGMHTDVVSFFEQAQVSC